MQWCVEDCGGTPARSKFHYDSEHADWAPCRVQDYNPTTGEFLIEWNDTRKQVWASCETFGRDVFQPLHPSART